MIYLRHLSKDPQLKPLLKKFGPFKLKKHQNICLRLCASIMSQQLSAKVAETIYERFMNLFGGNEPSPEQILKVSPSTLRSIGLSNAKSGYVHNVARFALEQGMDKKKLNLMKNEEVITYLTQIKGVGQWTVEMLLMFSLGREDVMALDDHGARQAIIKLYGLRTKDRKRLRSKIESIATAWAPYRTYAYLYLWQWRDEEKK